MTDQSAPPPQSPPQQAPPSGGGWAQPAVPTGPAGAGWVQPAMMAQRGPVTGLAKIGGIVLLLNGILWTLLWGAVVVAGVAAKGYFDQLGTGVGDAVGGAIATVGVFFLVLAILELLVAIGVLMSKEWGRIGGIVYSLLFGAVTLLLGLGAFASRADTTTTTNTAAGGVILLVFGVAYVYTLIVLAIRWRSRVA
jgi:hypothetical protein